MNRDELIEKMAEAIFNAAWGDYAWVNPATMDSERDEARSQARAALPAIEAAGVALVPVEATNEMVSAGISERHDAPEIARQAWTLATANIYRAMLAASPYRRDSDDNG